MSANTGRTTLRFRGVLTLYASAHNTPPILEIRVKRICSTTPYDRHDTRAIFIADLHGLGIPRLDAEADLTDKRPKIPLEELASGRTERLLSLLGQWIDEVRAHAGAPEAAGES